ncbi:clostripain-related cysteine peptidase [Desulfurobacterium sp.]
MWEEKILKKLFFILLIPFLFSCGYRESSYTKWIFAVYVAGDNNLSTFATYDVGEMMRAGSDDNVRVVVLCDRGNGTTLYEVKKGWLEPVERFRNLDTGNPYTLKLFLKKIVEKYRFSRVALVVWDHGDGWENAAFDDSAEDSLKMAEIKQVLDDLSFHLDFLGFDECLAGMTEVFYTFRNFANVTVASEAPEPGFGWDYFSLIEKLKEHPDWQGEALGRAAVDTYYQFYSNRTEYCYPECTLSAVSSSNASDIASAVNLFASYALNGTPSLFQEIYSARSNATEPETEYFPFYADLYSFADEINATTTSIEVKNAAVQIMAVLKGIYFKSTGANLKGVSIYFPNERDNFFIDYFNDSLNTFSSTLWDDFLLTYYGVLP